MHCIELLNALVDGHGENEIFLYSNDIYYSSVDFTAIFRDTRRCGPLRGPSSRSCGELRPSAEAAFLPFGKTKESFLYYFVHFW